MLIILFLLTLNLKSIHLSRMMMTYMYLYLYVKKMIVDNSKYYLFLLIVSCKLNDINRNNLYDEK